MGLFDSIKAKLKGNKKAQDGLEKAKGVADKAIDAGATKAGLDASKTTAAKSAAHTGIDSVKREIA